MYKIYTYIQPSGKRKVGCTGNSKRRIEEQQGGAEILAETDSKLEASHLEAYWKGRYQLELDETYVSETPKEEEIYIKVDKSGDWLTYYKFNNDKEFRKSDVTKVIFDINGEKYEAGKELADEMVMTSRSGNNIYFSVRAVKSRCTQISKSRLTNLVNTTL